MDSTFEKIVIGCDHTAISTKKELIEFISEQGIEVLDMGNSMDADGVYFCDIAERVALQVSNHSEYGGILICGNGVGMAIAANKIPGVRACVCNELYTVQYAKRDIHLNVLCMGVRIISPHLMKEIVKVWMEQKKGSGRFQERVNRLTEMEQKYLK